MTTKAKEQDILQPSASERPDKLYYVRDLFKFQKEMGLSSGKQWMLRQESLGKLKFRRDPKGWRRLTKDDMNGIIRAYMPGGKGLWSFDGSISKSPKKNVTN